MQPFPVYSEEEFIGRLLSFPRLARRDHNDTGVLMAPSPVLDLPFATLSWEATILIVPFLQVTAIRAVLLLVIHMVVAAVPIVVPPVMMMVVIICLNRRD
jgi:hypothetical protein